MPGAPQNKYPYMSAYFLSGFLSRLMFLSMAHNPFFFYFQVLRRWRMSPRTSAFPTTTGSVSLEDSTVSSNQIRYRSMALQCSVRQWFGNDDKFEERSRCIMVNYMMAILCSAVIPIYFLFCLWQDESWLVTFPEHEEGSRQWCNWSVAAVSPFFS